MQESERLLHERAILAKDFEDSGRPSEIKVLEKNLIGLGDYGDIYEALIDLAGRELWLAIKDFSRKGEAGSKYARESLEKFLMLKAAMVPTFSTYRINKKNPYEIFMSLGGLKKGELFFGTANNSVDSVKLKNNPIIEISNIDDFYENCFEILKRSSESRISIPNPDSYFYGYNEDKKTLYVIVGDFDNIPLEKNLTDSNLFDWNRVKLVYSLCLITADGLLNPYLNGDRNYREKWKGYLDIKSLSERANLFSHEYAEGSMIDDLKKYLKNRSPKNT
ncbi:MAG: hypothetical protein WC745_00240 [Patescibacteria group bacterium]|jgi:hypothetical protein